MNEYCTVFYIFRDWLSIITDVLFGPFMSFDFMRRAVAVCCALSFSITPVGSFLMVKRMNLIGDALSHSILPGVAIGYFYSGVSLTAMSIGGFISGSIVAILSIWISEKTSLQKDASFSGCCLGSLAFGVVLMSLKGSNENLLSLLFGSVLSINIYNVYCTGIISTITLISLAILYRALVIESFDPDFLKGHFVPSSKYIQVIFLLIVVLNLIISFQIIGTLMSIGLMMLPNLSARFWVKSLTNTLLVSVCIAMFCSWLGLLGSFYMSLPAGPVIVLCSSIIFIMSVLFGKYQGILYQYISKI